jgi:tetratricopeptide (TPR) repeat protein
MGKNGIAAYGLLILSALTVCLPAQSQSVDELMATCLIQDPSEVSLDLREKSCTAIIESQDASTEKRAFALSSRGWVEFSKHNLTNAISDFSSSLELKSGFGWPLVGRAISYLNSQKPREAIADFDAAIALYPNNPELLIGRGDAYNNLKQYDRGIADFDRAIELAPNNDEAMNDRAWALARKGEYVKAIQGYDAALEIATDLRSLILSNRCEAKAMAGHIESAIKDCDTALEIEPNDGWFLTMRGYANLRGKRYPYAIADYDAALLADSKNAFALFGRGIARIHLGETTLGQKDLVAAEALRPTITQDMLELQVESPAVQ